jgi:hypothetical protein
MGVRILDGGDTATLYCSTSDTAFGPVIYRSPARATDAYEEAESFLAFLPDDARRYSDEELRALHGAWLAALAAGTFGVCEQCQMHRPIASTTETGEKVCSWCAR